MKDQISQLRANLLKPLTKENIFYHYLPLLGVKSYLELSINVFNPLMSERLYGRSES